MPEPVSPTPRRPLALGVAVFAETVTAVTASDIGDGSVSLRVGDDRQAIQFFGSLETMRQVVTEAAAELGRLTGGDR